MGIILNTKILQSLSAISLSLIKNFIIPSTIKLPLVSPGCTLPVIITHYQLAIYSSSESKFVINKQSKSFPATVFPRFVFHIIDHV